MLKIATILAICTQAVTPQFHQELHEAAASHQIEPELLLAVVATESRCNPDAISSEGAIGYTQVVPSVWTNKAKDLGYNLNIPKDNLQMGATILADAVKQYGQREALRRYIGYNKTPSSRANASAYAQAVMTRYAKITKDESAYPPEECLMPPTRVVTKFLWWPRNIGGQIKWLITASWIETQDMNWIATGWIE